MSPLLSLSTFILCVKQGNSLLGCQGFAAMQIFNNTIQDWLSKVELPNECCWHSNPTLLHSIYISLVVKTKIQWLKFLDKKVCHSDVHDPTFLDLWPTVVFKHVMAWRNERSMKNITPITYLQNPTEKYPLMTCLLGKYIQAPVKINVGKKTLQNIPPRRDKLLLSKAYQ